MKKEDIVYWLLKYGLPIGIILFIAGIIALNWNNPEFWETTNITLLRF